MLLHKNKKVVEVVVVEKNSLIAEKIIKGKSVKSKCSFEIRFEQRKKSQKFILLMISDSSAIDRGVIF